MLDTNFCNVLVFYRPYILYNAGQHSLYCPYPQKIVFREESNQYAVLDAIYLVKQWYLAHIILYMHYILFSYIYGHSICLSQRKTTILNKY